MTRQFRPNVRKTKYEISFPMKINYCCNHKCILMCRASHSNQCNLFLVQYSTWTSFNLPFIHPGNRLPNSFFIASMLIQLPNWPLTPSLAAGIDSRFSSVQMYVLDSTRATSRGSVRAKKLWNIKHELMVAQLKFALKLSKLSLCWFAKCWAVTAVHVM